MFYLVGGQKEAELEHIKSEINQMIHNGGGVIEEKTTCERRKLAYEIKHQAFGFYVAVRFEMATEKIKEISRQLNLFSDVLRFIISRADELPELKSKEERLAASGRIQEVSEEKKVVVAPEEPKEEIKKELEKSEEAPAEIKEIVEEVKEVKEKETEASASEEDIDKKLDEILNS